MTDVTKAIEPKSDQMNADDLIGGPRTIKITKVTVQSTPEQPIWVNYEGDNNRPWKPCKTSARCLAHIWGVQSSQWVGLSCTLYNDTTVTWGGMAVGGIRVSHMQGIDKPVTLQLTKTRGKKGAVTIQPLIIGAQPVTVSDADWQDRARVAARQGKAAFTAWWSGNPDGRNAAKAIMGELKQLTEAADDEPAV